MNNKEILKEVVKEEFSKQNNYNMIIKRKRRKYSMKNTFLKFSLVLVPIIIVGIFFVISLNNKKDNKLEDDPNEVFETMVVIDKKEWLAAYNMGVNKERVPESPIYAYAIKEDNESYKIVSLHKDGTNFELVAVPIVKSRDNSDLSTHYKLTVVDGKLYFIHTAYMEASETSSTRIDDYDIEVYYVNIEGDHPTLEAKLQKVYQGYGIVNDNPIVEEGYLYYLDSLYGNIEVLALGNSEPKERITIKKPIADYYFNKGVLYATYGNASDNDHFYYFVDLDKVDNDGYNLTNEITKETYYECKIIELTLTYNYTLHYFDSYNRYLDLYASGGNVKLNGNTVTGKEDPEGSALYYNGKEIYNDPSKNVLLLNAENDVIRFCTATSWDCNEYFEYNVKTGKLSEGSKTFNYFILVYNDDN